MPSSLLVAAGEDAILQRLARQLDGYARLATFETANGLLWHARRFPPQTIVASANLPDIAGGDLLDILSILCPRARVILCGTDDPDLAQSLQALGGQFVPITSMPDLTLRQLYQVLNIEQPVPLDISALYALVPEQSWSTSAALSARQLSLLHVILEHVLRETAADIVLFSDIVGMPLICLGEMAGLRTEIMGPLLAPAFYAGGEFARQLGDQAPQAFYLYEGDRYNIYAFDVDRHYLLALAVDKAHHTGAPAPVWARAKQAIQRLRQVLRT
jgi:DNA-binding NarL/FixJ family response regulator